MAEAASNQISVDLSGQVAIVTGASQGLGRAMAAELARNGAKVACVARSADKLAESVAGIHDAGGEAIALTCDVKDRVSVDELKESLMHETVPARSTLLTAAAPLSRHPASAIFPAPTF